MALEPAVRAYVIRQVSSGVTTAVSRVRADLLQVFFNQLPRHASFGVSNMAAGTLEQDISWTVPIAGDYQIVASPTTGATPAGFLSASVKAGTKTATGCTLIVANRSAATIAAASFDVLVFPI